MKGYDTWLFHGETTSPVVNAEGAQVENSSAENEMDDLLRDLACGLDDGGI